MRLYTHRFSLMPWRVRIALHEKGLTHELVEVDVFARPPSAEVLRLNPFLQIPVLEDDGLLIAESMAILEYLEEQHPEPALLPRDVRLRATARQLMGWSTDYWPPAWKRWIAPRLPKPVTEAWTQASVAEGRAQLASHLDVLERQLAGSDWLIGDYSLADICYAPLVLVLERVELGDEIQRRARVSAWVSLLKSRPAIRDTMMTEP